MQLFCKSLQQQLDNLKNSESEMYASKPQEYVQVFLRKKTQWLLNLVLLSVHHMQAPTTLRSLCEGTPHKGCQCVSLWAENENPTA